MNFEVSLIFPEPNNLEFSWTLNSNSIEEQNTIVSITASELEEGNNTLVFSVVDNTPLVRTDKHHALHVNTLSWHIQKEDLGIESHEVADNSFVLYPTPWAAVLFLN